MCSLGSRNCSWFADRATSICSKTYKKTTLPWNSALKRCSRVETLQLRVLENTLNMGSYFTWIKMILFKTRCKGVQTQPQKSEQSCGECGVGTSHVTIPFMHLWYHVTMGRPKDILWVLLERNKTITTFNIWIKDNYLSLQLWGSHVQQFPHMHQKWCVQPQACENKILRS